MIGITKAISVVLTAVFISSFQSSLVTEINNARAENGRCNLYYDEELENFANTRADEICANGNTLSHDGWLNDEPQELKDKYWLGEILAKSKTVAGVTDYVKAWLNSKTHRRVMLDPRKRNIGIAIKQNDDCCIVVVIFGTPKEGNNGK